MNPPKKEYRFSLGDKVYLGSQEYELLAFDEQAVRLFDATFPLINKELPRDEFDRMLAENPLNDHLLQVVEEVSAPAQDDMSLEEAKRLINEYCTEVFDQEADFSDLHHVDLAFSRTSDSEHTVEVSADLIDCRLIYQVDNEVVASLQCHVLREDIAKMDRLDAETRFLGKQHISTIGELTEHRETASAEISTLTAQRQELRKEVRRLNRQGDTIAASEVKQKISAISNRLKVLRKEVVLCDGIAQRSGQVKENLERLINQKEYERKEKSADELFRRRGRAGRENVAGDR